MTSLKDKVILITGSGDVTGIGALTAKYIVKFQPKLVLTGRDSDRLDQVGQLCQEAGQPPERMLLVTADLNKDGDIDHLVTLTIQTFDALDVLINNAAIVHEGSILQTTMEDFDHVIQTNLRAPIYLTRICIPHLIKSKGNVVNISSVAAFKVSPHIASYAISKAALDHFTKILSLEVAKDGIRVNSVSPGAVRTNIFIKEGPCTEENIEQFYEQQCEIHPLKQIATPEDIAKAVTFLASADASFITGENLNVDGGRQHC